MVVFIIARCRFLKEDSAAGEKHCRGGSAFTRATSASRAFCSAATAAARRSAPQSPSVDFNSVSEVATEDALGGWEAGAAGSGSSALRLGIVLPRGREAIHLYTCSKRSWEAGEGQRARGAPASSWLLLPASCIYGVDWDSVYMGYR